MVGGLGSWSSYGIVRSRSKIAIFLGGGTTDRNPLANNRNALEFLIPRSSLATVPRFVRLGDVTA